MATEPAAANALLEGFGMEVGEIFALQKAAEESLSSPMLELSRRHLREASPAACGAIRNALIFARDQPEAIATWESVLTTLLANPVTLRCGDLVPVLRGARRGRAIPARRLSKPQRGGASLRTAPRCAES